MGIAVVKVTREVVVEAIGDLFALGDVVSIVREPDGDWYLVRIDVPSLSAGEHRATVSCAVVRGDGRFARTLEVVPMAAGVSP